MYLLWGVVAQWLEQHCVSLVRRCSLVVGALALNIRDYVPLVRHGSSVVGATLCTSCEAW